MIEDTYLTESEAIKATAALVQRFATQRTIGGHSVWVLDGADFSSAMHDIQRRLDGAHFFEEDPDFAANAATKGITFSELASYPDWREDGEKSNQQNVEIGDLAELLAAGIACFAQDISSDDFYAKNILKENPKISSRGVDVVCWRISRTAALEDSDIVIVIEAKASINDDAASLISKAEASSKYSSQKLFRVVNLLAGRLKDRDGNETRARKLKDIYINSSTMIARQGFILTTHDPTRANPGALTSSLTSVHVGHGKVASLRKAIYAHRKP